MRELDVPFEISPSSLSNHHKYAAGDEGVAAHAWPLLQAPLDVCLRCIGCSVCDALVQAFLLIGEDHHTPLFSLSS